MIPASLRKPKSRSSRLRKEIVTEYNRIEARPEITEYLLKRDIIESHISRSIEELEGDAPLSPPFKGKAFFLHKVHGRGMRLQRAGQGTYRGMHRGTFSL